MRATIATGRRRSQIRGESRFTTEAQSHREDGRKEQFRDLLRISVSRRLRGEMKSGARRGIDFAISIPGPAPDPSPQEERRSSVLEVGGVGFDELLLVLRDVVDGDNRI
jgi:hypothetical protein